MVSFSRQYNVSFSNKSRKTIFRKFVKKNKDKYRQLPDDTLCDRLSKLNLLKPFGKFYPEYRKIDKNNFELVYVEGVDKPYLSHEIKEDKWEKK